MEKHSHHSNAKEHDEKKHKKEVASGSKHTEKEKDAPLFDELRELLLYL